MLLALLACGGGSVEYERHDTGLGLSMSLPSTCKRSGPNDFQCAGGSAQGGTDLHFEAKQHWLGVVAGPRDPVLFHVTVRHINEPGPRREYLFWRRLLGSLKPEL